MPDVPALLHARSLTDRGFAHAFTARDGGVSEGPFASLNLGAAVGDDPEHVRENHRRLARAVGYDPAALHQTWQVHGGAVWSHTPDASPDDTRRVEADALVAAAPGVAVAVRVADCVPVLLADVATGRVAAAHAGWRGVVANVVGAALDALGPRSPADVVAAIGPSIGPCCFEVGDDVAAEIAAATPTPVVRSRPGAKPLVDLWRAVEAQLHARGVTAVEPIGRCTVCDPGAFFSFRRDGARSGRMVGVIVAKTPGG
ncbi:MAG: peptidoglycan editing factor PgeF [Polyangiales bacterium]